MNTVAFLNGCRAAVAAAWSECVPNGIYLDTQLERIPVEAKIERGEIPLAVIETDLEESDEFSCLDMTAFEGEVRFSYIVSDAFLVETHLVPKLETLRDYLRSAGLAYGQIRGKPRIDYGSGVPANQHFARQARPLLAGQVVARVIACEDVA